MKKAERTYYKEWKKIRKGKYALRKKVENEWTEEYTYNEAGVLEKEVRQYFSPDDFIFGDYYTTEIILYNEQGQKVECNKKREYKNSWETIGKRPNLKIEYKDKIFLEHTLYYYDSEGNLTREELKEWRADEGIEHFTTHHFYVKDDEYEEHLKVIVKEIV